MKITKLIQSYKVHCSKCVLTNCVDHKIAASYPLILILRRPSYAMLPVDLKDNVWFDNEALQVFKRLNELIRPKCFVAALILGISAMITILTLLAASLATLISEMRTAHFLMI